MKLYGMNGIPLEAQYVFRRGVEMVSRAELWGGITVLQAGGFSLSPVLQGLPGERELPCPAPTGMTKPLSVF